jgi:hypothetical protein
MRRSPGPSAAQAGKAAAAASAAAWASATEAAAARVATSPVIGFLRVKVLAPVAPVSLLLTSIWVSNMGGPFACTTSRSPGTRAVNKPAGAGGESVATPR